VNAIVLANALAAMKRIGQADARITPVLTLRHLSEMVDVPFRHLRALVGRQIRQPYKIFYLKKRVPNREKRMISVPNPTLKRIQDWIVRDILRHTKPHDASYAFHPGSRPLEAAEEHCGCEWLLKIDLHDFFHTIAEGRIANVFVELGFNRLFAFELARLVTIACEQPGRPNTPVRWPAIPTYQTPHEGMLPQGAPSSPMLANLVMFATDEKLSKLSQKNGMQYTRYADDLAFSCGADKGLADITRFKRRVLRELNDAGFQPNHRKTVIRGPGSRRIVLGMLVNGDQPRLPAEYKEMIRMHLHYLRSPKYGPSLHACARRTSVSGIFNHVRGLISWAQMVEPAYGAAALVKFQAVNWPVLEPEHFDEDNDDVEDVPDAEWS
jgi:hypothetical protein